jgi:hypothetical protein
MVAIYKISGGKNGDTQSILGFGINLLAYFDSDFNKSYFELSKLAKFALKLLGFVTAVETAIDLSDDCGLFMALIIGAFFGVFAYYAAAAVR